MKNEKFVKLSNFRLPKKNTPYWNRVLSDFCNTASETMGASYIEIGKQDIRGNFSISYFTDSHCIIKQEHFENKDMLLGYVVGYLHGKGSF